MRFLRFGTGKKTFVILPGLSVKSVLESAAAIARQYRAFSQEYTVYVFDRRENLPEEYSVFQMAEDTAAVMQALSLEGTCLFGASQGGMIAMLLAAKYPKLVKKLALGSTGAVVGEKEYQVIRHWAELAARGKREELFADFCEKVYPKVFSERFKSLFIELSHSVTDEELSRFVILCEGTKGFDARTTLRSIQIPVLILSSADDAVLGKEAPQELMHCLASNHQVSIINYTDRGHAAYDTAEDYPQRLKCFFDE